MGKGMSCLNKENAKNMKVPKNVEFNMQDRVNSVPSPKDSCIRNRALEKMSCICARTAVPNSHPAAPAYGPVLTPLLHRRVGAA